MSILTLAADGTVFENTYQLGIQRVARESLSRLAVSCDVTISLSAPAVASLPSGCRTIGPTRYTRPRRRFNLPARAWDAFARARARANSDAVLKRCDLYHSFYFGPAPPNTPSVVTVYDMILETNPEWYGDADTIVEAKRKAIESATRIISISRTAGDELMSCYPSVQDKVVPVLLGADHISAVIPESVPIAKDQYVVYVGDRIRYKNFRGLIQSLASSKWPKGVHLKVVGKPFTAAESIVLRRLGVVNKAIHVGRLSDHALSQLYAAATAMVFPSFAEGFGLPLVEAQRSACPVACSDIPVFLEVSGGAAAFFCPSDPMDIAAAVVRCCDPKTRNELIHAGLANAARLTWDRCAKETLAVYGLVVDGWRRNPFAASI